MKDNVIMDLMTRHSRITADAPGLPCCTVEDDKHLLFGNNAIFSRQGKDIKAARLRQSFSQRRSLCSKNSFMAFQGWI